MNAEEKARPDLAYEPPKVLASYTREELAETLRPHGSVPDYGGPIDAQA
jgi:hypothetical protein